MAARGGEGTAVPAVRALMLALPALVGAGSESAGRHYTLMQRIDTTSRYAIVTATHRWSPCIESRLRHAVKSRPESYDVVVLYDDTTLTPMRRQVEAFVNKHAHTYLVRFSAAVGNRTLAHLGYPQRAIREFSPFHSGFSKVAWVVWGARQAYEHVWFIEDDVLMPCAWYNFVRMFSSSNATRADELLAVNCSTRAGQPWSRRCNFCRSRPGQKLTKCLLATMRASRGLLRATDAALRKGVAAHHELTLPFVCQERMGAPGACGVRDISLDPRFKGRFSAPSELDARATQQMKKLMEVSMQVGGWHTLSQRHSGCAGRKFSLYHPSKCPAPPAALAASAARVRGPAPALGAAGFSVAATDSAVVAG